MPTNNYRLLNKGEIVQENDEYEVQFSTEPTEEWRTVYTNSKMYAPSIGAIVGVAIGNMSRKPFRFRRLTNFDKD